MAATPMGLRERKNERTRMAITRAALELSAELGFEHATVAQIAERADVSPRTVHAWFPSKEDIVIGDPELSIERLGAALSGGEGDVLDRLRAWLEAEGRQRSGEPDELMRLRHRVLLADPHLRALQRGRQQDAEEVIAAAVARDAGLPGDAVAPRALAAAILAVLLAMQQRFAQDGGAHRDMFDDAEPMLRAALGTLAPSRRP